MISADKIRKNMEYSGKEDFLNNLPPLPEGYSYYILCNMDDGITEIQVFEEIGERGNAYEPIALPIHAPIEGIIKDLSEYNKDSSVFGPKIIISDLAHEALIKERKLIC